ncbi:glycosyltransferase family 4 protein [Halorubrum ezzemoulense]|uniref:glycosyltransferase family 4 protein n=1 Tax=Halorubrum ezzemoulense TaxID=337243 RepID=UPI002331327E|nr:glycosyltransferase family 4 protein [Halorubrum ezzemoulense]MDB9250753.1 glycosyltransferase family 4 protein [Halorubrum ezzemoulense]MDB9260880.1 glycosyltransferase family 4 protein [Halorubrum ezzemoulense]MDB9264288.1 glycosyltransferase family 4 protein [Halorubrum ezzemoulense]MDB9267780.1 glycosyltransferase family 4 protein [Halorubrum ezzemoulense]MDB9271241.1 glycosyltransferase family 4 protein [Halorubrum ezzemoulense]
MNILYVVDQFPKLSESFIINEIHELKERGHDVSVFTLDRSTEEVTHEEVEEIDISVYSAKHPSYNSLPDLLSKYILNTTILSKIMFLEHPVYHAYCLHLGKQIMEAIGKEGEIDLIHAHFATESRLSVTYAAAYHDIPCTVTAHAYEVFSAPSVRRLQRVCTRFDHVIVPSEYNKRYLREEIGVETDMTVVPATTSVDKFEPSDDCVPGRLLTVARLVEKKGHEYAIDAVAELVNQGYDVEYHIVGTGEREGFLRNRVREHGIEDHVEFLGHVSDKRLIDELHDAELFVLPCVITPNGDRDITPVALREAMATETACVSTKISAIPEVITDEHDGYLVEPRDSDALQNAVVALLNDTEERRKLAKNARQTVETKFDISNSVDKLEDIFAKV